MSTPTLTYQWRQQMSRYELAIEIALVRIGINPVEERL